MHKNFKTLLALLVVVLLAACKTPQNISYFQDTDQEAVTLPTQQSFRLRPEDKINIVVFSKDASLSQLFNLTTGGNTYSNQILGASSLPRTTAGRNSSSSNTLAYTVDPSGNIDFPILGKLHVAGKTRQEVAQMVKNELIRQKQILDPVVTVEYVNLSVSVLGDVARPGRQDITNDHYTIFDAISSAGDLTITGNRENVKVMRDENGQMKTYSLNLCSIKDVAASPAYYLQQNDVVYVTPNDKKQRESTVNGNTVMTPSFWISVASLLTTITALIIR